MSETFIEKWQKTVDNKKSVLCAGLDPAEYEMGRGNEGLPQGTNKRDWALNYVEAVAPHCAAIKPNYQYWKDEKDVSALRDIIDLSHSKGLLVIDDSKLADIGSTNDAGIFYSGKNGFDAVTFSPFAGNIAEAAKQGKARNIGVICMCLMSNPEYERQKNSLIPISAEEQNVFGKDVQYVGDVPHIKQYMWLANQAKNNGLAGIVIGAPSKKNHLTEDEIMNAFVYAGTDMTVLCPGLGKQAGESKLLFTYFLATNVVVNVGRALMFPDGGATHQETAKYFNKSLNDERFKA